MLGINGREGVKRKDKRQSRSCGEKKEEEGYNGMEIFQERFLLTVLGIDRSLEIEYFIKKRSRKKRNFFRNSNIVSSFTYKTVFGLSQLLACNMYSMIIALCALFLYEN